MRNTMSILRENRRAIESGEIKREEKREKRQREGEKSPSSSGAPQGHMERQREEHLPLGLHVEYRGRESTGRRVEMRRGESIPCAPRDEPDEGTNEDEWWYIRIQRPKERKKRIIGDAHELWGKGLGFRVRTRRV